MFVFLRSYIIASSGPGAGGLIHFAVLLIPALGVGFLARRMAGKRRGTLVFWTITGVVYILLFWSRVVFYFPLLRLLGL